MITTTTTRTTIKRRLYFSLMKAAAWYVRGCDRADLDELSDREVDQMKDMGVRLRISADQLDAILRGEWGESFLTVHHGFTDEPEGMDDIVDAAAVHGLSIRH